MNSVHSQEYINLNLFMFQIQFGECYDTWGSFFLSRMSRKRVWWGRDVGRHELTVFIGKVSLSGATDLLKKLNSLSP